MTNFGWMEYGGFAWFIGWLLVFWHILDDLRHLSHRVLRNSRTYLLFGNEYISLGSGLRYDRVTGSRLYSRVNG